MFTMFSFFNKFFTITGNSNTMYSKNRIGNRKFHLKLQIVVFLISLISLIESEFKETSNTCFSVANSCCGRCHEEDNVTEDCYCDYSCTIYEDCCDDKKAVCNDLTKTW